MNDITISCKNLTVEYQLLTHKYGGLKDLILHPSHFFTSRKTFSALKNVNLEIPKGQSVALIGHNGCGKSTLLKAIAGVITPQHGTVEVRGRIGPMIELGAGFDPELSGLENIQLSCMLMGLSRKEIKARLADIIAFAEIGNFIYSPLKNYSSGMTARIGFACTTAISPEVLLVDEVLSVGDTNFAQKCLARINDLRKNGTTVVLVSHDLNAVQSFCQRSVVINEGEVVFDGNVVDGIETYQDLMHERLARSAPQQAKEEFERRRLLKLNAHDPSGPAARVVLKIIQNGEESDQVDFAKNFSIEIDAVFSNHERIRDGLAFGLGFARKGIVLTGFNNLDLKFPDPAELARSCGRVKVVYELTGGLPDIAAQPDLEILCGIHDDHISRELFMGHVLNVCAVNTRLGQNKHRYLMDTPDKVSSFAITPITN